MLVYLEVCLRITYLCTRFQNLSIVRHVNNVNWHIFDQMHIQRHPSFHILNPSACLPRKNKRVLELTT